MCIQKTYFRFKNTNRFKIKGLEMINHENNHHRKAMGYINIRQIRL